MMCAVFETNIYIHVRRRPLFRNQAAPVRRVTQRRPPERRVGSSKADKAEERTRRQQEQDMAEVCMCDRYVKTCVATNKFRGKVMAWVKTDARSYSKQHAISRKFRGQGTTEIILRRES